MLVDITLEYDIIINKNQEYFNFSLYIKGCVRLGYDKSPNKLS